MKLEPFDLEKALAGAKVWHSPRIQHAENVTRVGNRVAFTLPDDGDNVYQTLSDGKHTDGTGAAILFLVAPEPKRVTSYHMLISEDPSHLMAGNVSPESARRPYFDKYPVLKIVREQQPDGSWIIIGTRELEQEARGGE